MQCLAIFALVALKFSYVTCIPQASLTSNPAILEGLTCPRTVNFTCIGQDIPVLRWFFDGIGIASYAHIDGDENSLPLDVPSSIDIGSIQITSVEASTTVDGFNATSILSTNISILEKFNNIQCGSNEARSNLTTVNVIVLGSAPSPFKDTADCSLVSSVGNALNISLRWSPSFNSQYNVEMYNLTVTPDLSPSCSGLVPPSENYSCSGLDPETNYSITVSAINCGDQMGERASLNLQPMLLAPKPPQAIEVMSNSIEWMESLTSSGNCSFTGGINYTLTLVDSTGRIVERNVSSDNCTDGICSTTLSPSSQICSVNIVASNAFGSSDPTSTSIVPPRLTSPNRVLLGFGVVLWFMATAGICVVFIVMKVKKIEVSKLSKWFLILLLCGVLLLMLLSVALWVALGFQVGLQDSTCDDAWKTSRDGLIISSFSFSLISLLIVAATLVAVSVYSCTNEKKRSGGQDIPLKPKEEEDSTDVYKQIKETRIDTKKRLEEGNPPVYDVTHSKTPTSKDATQQEDYSHLPTDKPVKEDTYNVLQRENKPDEDNKQLPDSAAPPEYDKLKREQHPSKQPTPSLEPPHGTRKENPPPKPLHQNSTTEEPPPPPPKPPHTNEKSQPRDPSKDSQEETFRAPLYLRIQDERRPCSTMRGYNKSCQRLQSPPPSEQLAEWFPSERAWNMMDLTNGLLVVYVMDNAMEMTKLIMPIVNDAWRNLFILGPRESSNIRINVQDTSDNWSALGSAAKNISKDKPTMVLNFSNMDNEEIKATILHQFGHALGLGHALMKPDDWEVLKPHLDVRAMMEFYGSQSMEEFEMQWTGKGLDDDVVNYDEGSIMRYSTNLLWLKENTVKDAETKKKLKIFRKHASSIQNTPSTNDRKTLNIVSPSMSVDNLLYLGNESAGTEVSLTEVLATDWHAIGKQLGVNKTVLDSIKDSFSADTERLEHVWQEWCDHTDELSHKKKYPFTWEGLRTLLMDIGKRNVAGEFFPFLDAL